MAWVVAQTWTFRQHNFTINYVSSSTNHSTKPTAPSLKCLLFYRTENQTTYLFSACQEVISTNILKYEDIYFLLYCMTVEIFLLWNGFFPRCRMSVGTLRQGKRLQLSLQTFFSIRIWAICRETSSKSIFLFMQHCSQATKVAVNYFLQMLQRMPLYHFDE